MRIAYIANYQGPTLVARRPVVRNLSMSNRVKMELIATLLAQQSHDVVVISPGEPGEPRLRLYPAFSEPHRFNPEIPVEYASALPVRTLTAAWSCLSTLRILRKAHREKPFDVVVIFNMKWPQLAAAAYALRQARVPVVLEYEDDAFTSVHEERSSPLNGAHRTACRRAMATVSGCIGVSPYLLSQIPATIPSLLLRGVVGDDVIEAERSSRGAKKNRVVFSGTHIESNGVGNLIEAWKELAMPGWELHITGHGHLTPVLQSSAASVPTIVFHGLVSKNLHQPTQGQRHSRRCVRFQDHRVSCGRCACGDNADGEG
jgi:glycosyltransferase involved in cell wall biosynthesis